MQRKSKNKYGFENQTNKMKVRGKNIAYATSGFLIFFSLRLILTGLYSWYGSA